MTDVFYLPNILFSKNVINENVNLALAVLEAYDSI